MKIYRLKPNDKVVLKMGLALLCLLTFMFSIVLCATNDYWYKDDVHGVIRFPFDLMAYMSLIVLSIAGLMLLTTNFKK